MKRSSLMQQARTYQEMVYRYLRVCREYPDIKHTAPEPPPHLNNQLARKIFEDCEREFNRGAK